MDKLRKKREREGQQVNLLTRTSQQRSGVAVTTITLTVSCLILSGGGEDVGLHSAPDGGGNPDAEEEEQELCHPEAPGQSPPHSGEEPIKRLSAGQDFQCQQVRLTGDWLLDKTVVASWKCRYERVKSLVCDVMSLLSVPH